ncbi:hypothetical protein Aduo_016545 [Ancylostoma duodenale]
MMQFMLLFSRQGKLRLQKWYTAYQDKMKKKICRELITQILARKPKMCAFLEYKDLKIVYKRYASLYFCCAIEQTDNELICLEVIHRYVELLDKYFGSVCELDIIFNFEKAYFILDEFLLAGEIQETSKKQVLKAIAAQDLIQELHRNSSIYYLYVVGIFLEKCYVDVLELLPFGRNTARSIRRSRPRLIAVPSPLSSLLWFSSYMAKTFTSS